MNPEGRVIGRACVSVGLLWSAACGSASNGNDVVEGGTVPPRPEAGATDGTVAGAPIDDAGLEDAGTCDHTLANAACWATFVSEGLTENTSDFFGAAFDGRSVTFVNRASGPQGFTVQYSTRGSFAARSSWSLFNTQQLGAAVDGFATAAFDGRYVYLAPNLHSTVVRYDTSANFGAGTSWSALDLDGPDASPTVGAGFLGAVFDGRYIYFVPVNGGLATRYDTRASFDAGASWSSFDMTALAGGRVGFAGGAFDGRYVYFVPHGGSAGPQGVVVRYDTQASFVAVASWATFDATALSSSATGFSGAAFDGRYIYFVPNTAGAAGLRCVVVRYDTQGTFGAASSWSFFDTSPLGSSGPSWRFEGAAFDGRYVYFAPGAAGDPLLRYDSRASFESAASWSAFELSAGNIAGFHGAVFDGRYLYLVPADYSLVERFDARTPPLLPPGSMASFF